MSSRNERAAIASQTVQVLATGAYTSPAGKAVDLLPELNHSINETRLYAPGQLAKLAADKPPMREDCRIEVVNATTLAVARQLHTEHGPDGVALLNFASARNPGGGFLSGSQAQEESLARASGLFASLQRMTDYYAANRRFQSALYTDHMIYSPLVPVFRDDADVLLEDFWCASIITAPAVNAGVVRSQEPENVADIGEVMRRRIGMVLALAARQRHEALVLGAWGCGVFANDPLEIAQLFGDYLLGSGRYARTFTKVVFAVLDRRGDIIRPFATVFGARTS